MKRLRNTNGTVTTTAKAEKAMTLRLTVYSLDPLSTSPMSTRISVRSTPTTTPIVIDANIQATVRTMSFPVDMERRVTPTALRYRPSASRNEANSNNEAYLFAPCERMADAGKRIPADSCQLIVSDQTPDSCPVSDI